MIIIINGSVGVGKSSVSRALQEKFHTSIMLDGDYIAAVHPFNIYDDSRIEYCYETLLFLIKFHKTNGYNDFVINYVFESDVSLKSLTKRLQSIVPEIYTFWITCSEEEHKKRISKRNNNHIEWEMKRFIELNNIQMHASKHGFIGEKIETEQKSIQEVADIIWGKVKKNL
jgi:broad-specificity NMP kinase